VIGQLIQIALLLTGATYSAIWACQNLEGRDIWWGLYLTAAGVIVGAYWIAGKL
jgi:hypothetical protein